MPVEQNENMSSSSSNKTTGKESSTSQGKKNPASSSRAANNSVSSSAAAAAAAVGKDVAPAVGDRNKRSGSSATAAATNDEASFSPSKRSRTQPIDFAHTLSLRPGDRIEVQWFIHMKDDGDASDIDNDNNTDNDNKTKNENDDNTESRWWGATLLEHDGRTDEGVAIRTLEYDSYAEGGFPDISREDVIFIGEDTLVNYRPSDNEEEQEELDTLCFRVVRDQQDQAVHMSRDESTVMQVIDSALMGALEKNSKSWDKLPAAQKAIIAEQIASKKQKLLDLLINHDKAVVTPTDMREILAKTMK